MNFIAKTALLGLALTISATSFAEHVLKNKFAKVIFSDDGKLIKIENANGKTIIKKGVIWHAKLNNGKEYSAPNSKVSIDDIANNKIVLNYRADELKVKILLLLQGDKLIFKPQVLSKQNPVEFFSMPEKLYFSVKGKESLFFTGMSGLEVRPSFFKPLYLENSVFRELKRVGSKGINTLLPEAKIKLDDDSHQKITQTKEGKKWLGENLVIDRKAPAPRPSVDDKHIPLFKCQNGTFVAAYPIGKGYFIRYASKAANYSIASGVYHKILTSLLKKEIKKNKSSSFVIGQICKDFGIRGLDYKRNHLSQDAAKLTDMTGKSVKVDMLRNWVKLERALKNPQKYPVLINYLYEAFPCKNYARWKDSVDLIKSYIAKGGIWIDFAGGYSFHYAKVPTKWNPPIGTAHPDGGYGFSDFLYKNGAQNTSFALYGVQDFKDPVLDRKISPDKFTVLTLFHVKPCGNGEAVYVRKQRGWSTVGNWFKFPEFRIKVGGTLKNDYLEYGKANQISRKLEDKVPSDTLKKWKRSVFLKINDKHSKIASWTKFVKDWKGAGPLFFHHADWSHLGGRFDQYYPDFFPYDPRYGNVNDLKKFYKTVKDNGHLVMPYTQPVFWDVRDKFMKNRPLLDEAMKLAEKSGLKAKNAKDLVMSMAVQKKNSEKIKWANRLIYISPWCPVMEEINKRNYDKFVNELGASAFFHDSVGAEYYRMDFSGNAPHPTAHFYGLIAMGNLHRSYGKAPLATEGASDFLANTYSMMCGMNQAITPTVWGVYTNFTERYAPGTIRPFPLYQYLAHDKVIMIGHNLGNSVINREMVTWYLATGYQFQYMTDLWHLKKDLAAKKSWVKTLSALQNAIGPLTIGKAMTSCKYIAENVLEVEYDGGCKIVANLQPEIFNFNKTKTIAPWGFLAFNKNDLFAGIVQKNKKAVWFLKQHGLTQILTPPAANDVWQPNIDTRQIKTGTPVKAAK